MNWDDRFHVSPSKDNSKVHTYFKEYFDKPSQRPLKKSLPTNRRYYIDGPNLEKSISRKSERIPRHSRAFSQKSSRAEAFWNDRFNVTYSRGNEKFHSSEREYFFLPRQDNQTELGAIERNNISVETRRGSVFKVLLSPRNYHQKQKIPLRVSKMGMMVKEKSWDNRIIGISDQNSVWHDSKRCYFEKLPKRIIINNYNKQ